MVFAGKSKLTILPVILGIMGVVLALYEIGIFFLMFNINLLFLFPPFELFIYVLYFLWYGIILTVNVLYFIGIIQNKKRV